ncbi:MAG TPA: hypothetical protein VFS83_17595 [Ktedonobacterales bacterium]|nr:hypothetical protein [Ktedonobacterales bacterium]
MDAQAFLDQMMTANRARIETTDDIISQYRAGALQPGEVEALITGSAFDAQEAIVQRDALRQMWQTVTTELRRMLRDPRIVPFAEARNQLEASLRAMDILLKRIEVGLTEAEHD